MNEQQFTRSGATGILSGIFVGSIQEPDWNLLDVSLPHDSRIFERYIQFEKHYTETPVVHVGVAGFDIDNDDNSRLRVRAANIQRDGFTLQIESWLHTRMWSVEVVWTAFGEMA